MPKDMAPVNPPTLAKPAGYSHGSRSEGASTAPSEASPRTGLRRQSRRSNGGWSDTLVVAKVNCRQGDV